MKALLLRAVVYSTNREKMCRVSTVYVFTTAVATIIFHNGTFRRHVYRSRIQERTIR
jgi:hypothetical protein